MAAGAPLSMDSADNASMALSARKTTGAVSAPFFLAQESPACLAASPGHAAEAFAVGAAACSDAFCAGDGSRGVGAQEYGVAAAIGVERAVLSEAVEQFGVQASFRVQPSAAPAASDCAQGVGGTKGLAGSGSSGAPTVTGNGFPASQRMASAALPPVA